MVSDPQTTLADIWRKPERIGVKKLGLEITVGFY